MTAFRHSIATFIVLSFLIGNTVFAQDVEIATTTPGERADEEAAVAETPWYTSERISGNIEVGDFVVGPGRTEISVAPGETVIQEISVTNRISSDRTFTLVVDDIMGTADGSSAVVLADGERGPYSIRDYISFPESTFRLELGERARIPITITIPPDAEPGGHYGSIFVTTERVADDSGSSVPRSPIIARIGSLFFITIKGESEIGGETKSITTINDDWWYESGPVKFGILYENTGSLHLNPYGEISINNMLGDEVGFVELEPWFVLPKSLRNREVVWDREFLFGRYTATAKVNRGYEDIVDEVSVTFWVLPWKIVGGTFLIIFIIVFGIRAFFRNFQFTRKTT
jgi:hypothetical protein